MNASSGSIGSLLSSKLSRAHSPPKQSELIIPRKPARVSRASISASQASTLWMAPGASTGLPMLTMPSIRSGRREASPRASMPPRLWPTMVTLRSRRIAIVSMRRSRRSAASRVQPTFTWICER